MGAWEDEQKRIQNDRINGKYTNRPTTTIFGDNERWKRNTAANQVVGKPFDRSTFGKSVHTNSTLPSLAPLSARSGGGGRRSVSAGSGIGIFILVIAYLMFGCYYIQDHLGIKDTLPTGLLLAVPPVVIGILWVLRKVLMWTAIVLTSLVGIGFLCYFGYILIRTHL